MDRFEAGDEQCSMFLRSSCKVSAGHDQKRFARLLEILAESPGSAREMGGLMREAHESYSACGLGSDGTDLLVEMAKAAGPAHGLFGAKITGGGSGGTVAILGTDDAQAMPHNPSSLSITCHVFPRDVAQKQRACRTDASRPHAVGRIARCRLLPQSTLLPLSRWAILSPPVSS